MKPVISAAAFAVLLIAQIVPVAAQDGFTWFYDRYIDPDPFQTRFSLTYGVPESDNIQFNALCQIGNRGTYAVLHVGADIGSHPDGADVDIQFSGKGFNRVLQGVVVGRNAEVGITGVEIAIELDDALWRGLAGLSEIRYRLAGLPALSISLRGSGRPISRFLDDCQTMPGPQDEASSSGGGGSNEGQTANCAVFGQLRSVSDGPATSIVFVNDSSGYRAVNWLDYDGNPIFYAALNPGESYIQQTAVGHPWMITDGPGNCLEIYLPPEGESTFSITVEGNGEGGD